MPENCYYCRFNYDHLCHAAMQSFAGRKLEDNGRLKDCPLIEVAVGSIGSDKAQKDGNEK